MDFSVEFYETETGTCPVREFLDELKASDPDDFAAVVAGLAKLRHRQYHREPISKALGDGLFELRHVGKLNTRVLWFFVKYPRLKPWACAAVPISHRETHETKRETRLRQGPQGPSEGN